MKRIMKRQVWQLVVLLTVMTFGLLHTIDHSYPSAHALCPFGGLATLYSLIERGEFIHRVHSSAVFLLLAVLVTAVFAGRAFCGRLCPFGTVNEWVHRAGRKLGIKQRFELPYRLHHTLRYAKYLVLVLVLYYTWTAGKLVYRAWCPWSAFMTIFDPAEIVEDIMMGGLILVILLLLSLFIERFFCRYLCPLGAALAVFNRFGVVKPERHERCVQCGLCERVCPTRIEIRKTYKVRDPECIHCYNCITRCPHKGSMSLNFSRLQPHVAGMLVVVLFAGTVAASVAAGYWERGRTLSSITGETRTIEEVHETLQDIRASDSLEDVSEKSAVSLEEILSVLGLPESTSPETTVRDVTEETGYSRRDLLIMIDELMREEGETR